MPETAILLQTSIGGKKGIGEGRRAQERARRAPGRASFGLAGTLFRAHPGLAGSLCEVS